MSEKSLWLFIFILLYAVYCFFWGVRGSRYNSENPMVRADMIYYKTPNDGALFAPGSLSWCVSLSYNNYNNNVSKILENAIRGFLKDGALP